VNPIDRKRGYVHAWLATLFATEPWDFPGMSRRTPEHLTTYIADLSVILSPTCVFRMLARYDRSLDIEEISLVY
jgi:hypothetical protein